MENNWLLWSLSCVHMMESWCTGGVLSGVDDLWSAGWCLGQIPRKKAWEKSANLFGKLVSESFSVHCYCWTAEEIGRLGETRQCFIALHYKGIWEALSACSSWALGGGLACGGSTGPSRLEEAQGRPAKAADLGGWHLVAPPSPALLCPRRPISNLQGLLCTLVSGKWHLVLCTTVLEVASQQESGSLDWLWKWGSRDPQESLPEAQQIQLFCLDIVESPRTWKHRDMMH